MLCKRETLSEEGPISVLTNIRLGSEYMQAAQMTARESLLFALEEGGVLMYSFPRRWGMRKSIPEGCCMQSSGV